MGFDYEFYTPCAGGGGSGGRRDGKRVSFEFADAWQVEEEVSARDSAARGSGKEDACPAVGERGEGCVVTGEIPQCFTRPQGAVKDPDGTYKNRDPDGVFRDVGAVHADGYNDEHEEDDVDDVEEFVADGAQEEHGGEDEEHGEACDPAHDVVELEELVDVAGDGEGFCVDYAVD